MNQIRKLIILMLFFIEILFFSCKTSDISTLDDPLFLERCEQILAYIPQDSLFKWMVQIDTIAGQWIDSSQSTHLFHVQEWERPPTILYRRPKMSFVNEVPEQFKALSEKEITGAVREYQSLEAWNYKKVLFPSQKNNDSSPLKIFFAKIPHSNLLFCQILVDNGYNVFRAPNARHRDGYFFTGGIGLDYLFFFEPRKINILGLSKAGYEYELE